MKGRCNKCGKWAPLWPLTSDKMYCDECFKDYDWIEVKGVYGVDDEINAPSEELINDAENRL